MDVSEDRRIVPVSEVPEDGTLLFRVREGFDVAEVVLVRLGGESSGEGVAAWKNYCQHWTDVRLDKGSGAPVRNGELVCQRHAATFESDTGYCNFGPCEGASLDGVETVLALTHHPPDGGYPEWVAVHTHPMLDGPRNDPDAFDAATETLRASLEAGETVLVHCSAGASRSVSVAAAAIAVTENVGIREAFGRVGDAREGADPHPALVRRAAAFVEGYRA